MAGIVLERIGKTYPGGHEAVRDLSLTIEEGELMVLVGPSGCGKSTTLRMIAGLEEISSGVLRMGQRVVNTVPSKDRDLAMVFQSYALYPHMTVAENLGFALSLRGTGKSEVRRKVLEVAQLLELDSLLDRKPAALSGGQRQRVALGRAIVRSPACFLFDEPLSNLDARLRVAMRTELKRLHRTLGRTAVYVTHDQEEAMTLGDRVAVMNAGRLQQCASPIEIYQRPCNRFVATFLGTPPMNMLDVGILADASMAIGTARLPLPPWARAAVGDRRVATLGIRPQGITLVAPGRDDEPQAIVRTVEHLGECMNVSLTLDRTDPAISIVAQVPARASVLVDEACGLRLDPTRLHLFEPDGDGRALAHPPDAGTVS